MRPGAGRHLRCRLARTRVAIRLTEVEAIEARTRAPTPGAHGPARLHVRGRRVHLRLLHLRHASLPQHRHRTGGISRRCLRGERWTGLSWPEKRRPPRTDRDLARGPARLYWRSGWTDGALLGGPGSRISLTLPEAWWRRIPRPGGPHRGRRARRRREPFLAFWLHDEPPFTIQTGRAQASSSGLPSCCRMPVACPSVASSNKCTDDLCRDYCDVTVEEGQCGRLSVNGGRRISRWEVLWETWIRVLGEIELPRDCHEPREPVGPGASLLGLGRTAPRSR